MFAISLRQCHTGQQHAEREKRDESVVYAVSVTMRDTLLLSLRRLRFNIRRVERRVRYARSERDA